MEEGETPGLAMFVRFKPLVEPDKPAAGMIQLYLH